MIEKRFKLYKNTISDSDPNFLEGMVRGILIHYFFHISQKNRIELFDIQNNVERTINVLTPTLFRGTGVIRIAPRVVFGVPRSPGSHSCSYIEARTPESSIEIGSDTVINNAAVIISEGAGIKIGSHGLFGPELQIIDSNFHQLALGYRHLPDDKPKPVFIGNDVLIGARVTILKGANIGDGCIISAGCMIPPSFIAPSFSIIAGNPAKIVGKIN